MILLTHFDNVMTWNKSLSLATKLNDYLIDSFWHKRVSRETCHCVVTLLRKYHAIELSKGPVNKLVAQIDYH